MTAHDARLGSALVLGCSLLAFAGQAPFEPAALWSPVSGACLFYLLRFGVRQWHWVLLAAMAALLAGGTGLVDATLAASMMTAAYAWMAHALRKAGDLGSLRAVAIPVRIVGLGTLLLCIGIGLARLLGAGAPWPDFMVATARNWIAELNGIMVLVPALTFHARRRFWQWRGGSAELAEAALQAASIVVVLFAVFAVAAAYDIRFFSIVFLPLIWIAVRWGLPGSSLALVALQIGIWAGELMGHATSALQLQLLTFALCVMGLTLGAVVTQRRRMEARLQEKQAALNQALQLASVGEMTSALAHELSQPVAALSRYLGACQVLAAADRSRELLQDTLKKANAEATRASDIVIGIRDFYRRGAVAIAAADAALLVKSAIQSVQARAERAGITITLRSSSPLPPVAVDALQVETAVLNVLNNAIDALSDAPAPREIRVASTTEERVVKIVISDSGPGVDAQVASRLFEPFNTSKASGMGMGLALSRSLLRASGGDIQFGTPAATGATFTITLPLPVRSREPLHG